MLSNSLLDYVYLRFQHRSQVSIDRESVFPERPQGQIHFKERNEETVWEKRVGVGAQCIAPKRRQVKGTWAGEARLEEFPSNTGPIHLPLPLASSVFLALEV
jgi:hypothetical protein